MSETYTIQNSNFSLVNSVHPQQSHNSRCSTVFLASGQTAIQLEGLQVQHEMLINICHSQPASVNNSHYHNMFESQICPKSFYTGRSKT